MNNHVKTGKVEGRRELRFSSLADVSADLDRLESAQQAGHLHTLGNWSAGQIFEHLAIVLQASLDGFPFSAPAIIRFLGKLVKKKTLGPKPIGAGIQLKGASSVMIPDANTTFEKGLTRLRQQIARIDAGEHMTHPSPVFGQLSHEQWLTLQRKHCALHLSFLKPGDSTAPATD